MPTTTAIDLLQSLQVVFDELTYGSAPDNGWVLNPKDPGLLQSLDQLSSEQASAMPGNGGASIAAHVDHLRYGLELLNRWNRGEDPFATADFVASWKRTTVSNREWSERRAALAREIEAWRKALNNPRDIEDATTQNGIVGSVAHLAYHLGAIRQIDRAARGPADQWTSSK